MGFFNDVKDFVSSIASGRGQDRSTNRISGNMTSSPRPRARPNNVQRVNESDNDFRDRQSSNSLATVKLGGNSFSIPANQGRPTAVRNATGRSNVTGSSRSRTSGNRGVTEARQRQPEDTVIEGVQSVGRGRAVTRRIEDDAPNRSRTAQRRQAVARYRRFGELGRGQRPLLPVTTAARTLKALTGA